MDDIFAVIGEGENETEILKELNEIDNNIKFTIETENNNTINYLDVKITKNENKTLDTTIFRKPNSSGEIIKANCKTPYTYKIASLRAYINRAITICSNQELLKKELKTIEEIATKNGYRKNLIQELFRKWLKTLEKIEAGQRVKKINTMPIPYCRGATNILKREGAKFNVNFPIKPNPNIYQIIKSDRDTLEPTETAGIYKIEYTKEDNIKGCYIGVTKRKIKKRIAEHQSDKKHQRENTALSRLEKNENIEIKFENTRKLAEYHNKRYAFCRESVEIAATNESCNDVEHCVIDKKWRKMLKGEQSMREKDNQPGTAKTHRTTTEDDAGASKNVYCDAL